MGYSEKNHEGQTVVEYVALLAVVVGFFISLLAGLRAMGLQQKLLRPIQEEYAKTYQYGHPKALGYEDPGGPVRHPRAVETGNFRIFTPKP